VNGRCASECSKNHYFDWYHRAAGNGIVGPILSSEAISLLSEAMPVKIVFMTLQYTLYSTPHTLLSQGIFPYDFNGIFMVVLCSKICKSSYQKVLFIIGCSGNGI
jgi:hypothetical protein